MEHYVRALQERPRRRLEEERAKAKQEGKTRLTQAINSPAAIAEGSQLDILSSFQKWREETLLIEARPTVFAELGYGALHTAMVETAVYGLEAVQL